MYKDSYTRDLSSKVVYKFVCASFDASMSVKHTKISQLGLMNTLERIKGHIYTNS